VKRRAPAPVEPAVTLADLARDSVRFLTLFITKTEKGQPWTLPAYWVQVLTYMFAAAYRTRLWSEPKKSGKTFLGATLAWWWAATHADTEILIASNDFEQAASRVFDTMKKLLRHNPALASFVKRVYADRIEMKNGTSIKVIANDWRGAAGSRHSLYVLDEVAGFTDERAERLVEELTPILTEADSWGLWTSTAGILGESKLLEKVYRRGLAGQRLDPELEVHAADDLCLFWSHTKRQAWQIGLEAEKYYKQQEQSLRPSTFARLHGNQWVTAEAAYLSAEDWDACVDPEHAPIRTKRKEIVAFVGGDVAYKGDNAAFVALGQEPDGTLVLLDHALLRPPVETQDIVAILTTWAQRFVIGGAYLDPFQAMGLVQALRQAHWPVAELPQTAGNLTRAGQAVYDVVRGRHLVAYRDAELRQQILNTVAIESPRGFRISKATTSRKIDLVAALSFAVLAVYDATETPATDVISPEEAAMLRSFSRTFGGFDPAEVHDEDIESGQ
jgi:phage terminase large subunit-like protein